LRLACRALGWALVGASAVAALFLAWPSPIDSHAFDPGPLRPVFDIDRTLADGCVRISEGEISHSDKLVVDDNGRVFAGDETGRIHVFTSQEGGSFTRSVFAEPGGHPFELEFDSSGNLVGADHEGSHFRVDPSGRVTRLATLVGHTHGTAGVAVSRNGVLYYGAHPEGLLAGDRSGFLEMLAAHQASELRAFDPATGVESTLATGLFRPVGVELSQNEDFVVVAEFFAYRVTRHWLSGPRAGTTDRLLDRLPGFVDGVGSDGRGTFYVSMPAYAPAFLARLHERPYWKDQLAKVLPTLLRLGAGPRGGPGIVLAVDESGRILRTFQDPEGGVVDTIPAAEVHAGHLYLGSITSDWIARCPLPEEPPVTRP
jgi:sugar lactone lactonase YvrE